MRKNWFAFVAQTRKRVARKEKREVTHREAMKIASELWPKEKLKIANRIKRANRKKAKDQKQEPPPQAPAKTAQ